MYCAHCIVCSGMERLEFKELMQRGKWIKVPAGSRVVKPEQVGAECWVQDHASLDCLNAAYLCIDNMSIFVEYPIPQPASLQNYIFQVLG